MNEKMLQNGAYFELYFAPKDSQLSSIKVKLYLSQISFIFLNSTGFPSIFIAKIALVFFVIALSIIFSSIFNVDLLISKNLSLIPY